jgi:alpha-L-fucosidase 2
MKTGSSAKRGKASRSVGSLLWLGATLNFRVGGVRCAPKTPPSHRNDLSVAPGRLPARKVVASQPSLKLRMNLKAEVLVVMLMSALVLPGVVCAAEEEAPPSGSTSLWYAQPAQQWTQALPVGNGRLGAMVFGGVGVERIQLNEDSLWSGGPQDADNPEALEHLDAVRALLAEGKFVEAQSLTIKTMVCKGAGSGTGGGAYHPYGSYQTLGDIMLEFDGHKKKPSDYRRLLDLDTAIATTEYTVGKTRYTREVFGSAVDQVLVARISCSTPGELSFTVTLDRDPRRSSQPWKNNSSIEPFETSEHREEPLLARVADANTLAMSGRAWAGDAEAKEDTGTGMRFEARLAVMNEGGRVKARENALLVEEADAVTLLLSAATDYRADDPAFVCGKHLAEAGKKSYEKLRQAHVAEHQSLFRRVDIDLGTTDAAALPTDERLARVEKGESDPALAALYFQYGRYLLIASSRPGTMPANLQGIWCDHIQAPWNADYHHNINDQMNYWPAEACNLSECHMPFLKYLDSLRVTGRRTAKVHYGADGWVVHTISNVWGYTSPGEHPGWGQFTAAGGWLCQHLWEHYAFTGDRDYLAWAYPVMKESAEFYLDFLVEDEARGWLVTSPSNSPENKFRTADGQVAGVCAGPSMDMQILWDLFTNCMAASEILGVDDEFRATLKEKRAKLAPPQIGKHGQLQEWLEDYDEPEPGHRHMSHLFALHPGEQITLRGTPGLAQAARVSLERRLEHGGGHTGWSRAWMINFWARLAEGNLAEENVRALLAKSTLPNMFDNHAPFQIDGNFGGTAGIAEMLLQSHGGEIVLLPALPDAWTTGHVKGLRARGGFEVDIAWKAGALTSARVCSELGRPCIVRYGDKTLSFDTEAGKAYPLDGQLEPTE